MLRDMSAYIGINGNVGSMEKTVHFSVFADSLTSLEKLHACVSLCSRELDWLTLV